MSARVDGRSELTKRILFTLLMLAVYRIGVHVPTPGVDGIAVAAFFGAKSGSIFGLFNTFTGGALSQFSILALGIMPYISASIIFQLLVTLVPALEALKKEGDHGRKKISQYTKYLTIGLAVVQGYGISSWLLNSNHLGQPIVVANGFGDFFGMQISFRMLTVLTLTTGTCFLMWVGDMITEKGIGNGTSLIIFSGIVASIPAGAQKLLGLFQANQLSFFMLLVIAVLMVSVVAAVIYVEVAQRRIPVQYSQRTGSGMQNQQNSHLPVKINFPGVIPPIFASSLLMFPATIAQFSQAPWLKGIQDSLNPSGSLYNIAFVILIVLFSFFYSEVVFNTKDVAENLKKYGGFIPGVRAGQATSDYIKRVLDRVNVLGATYLSAVCVLPVLVGYFFTLPFIFGGTSLLILVGVGLDTAQQVQSYLLAQKYEGILSGKKLKGRRVQF